MDINNEVVVLVNRTSKIISSLKVDNINLNEQNINKQYVQKLLTMKLDLEDFIQRLNELSVKTNELLPKAKTKNLLTLLENNKSLIETNNKQFKDLLNKINLLLDQLKLNKELSKLIK